MSSFRDAEARGLDLERVVPALVQGRTISSASDIAALLHGRITKRVESVSHCQAERIVGLLPAATGVTEPDMAQALEDRRSLIEQQTRSLTLEAIENRQPWTLQLGRPPAAGQARCEQWLLELDTIAAYRDRWQISGNAVLGELEPRSREQLAQREAAQRAMTSAGRMCYVHVQGETGVVGMSEGTTKAPSL